MFKRLFHSLTRAADLVLPWLLAAGVAVRLTVRDGTDFTAIVFYALPLPAMMAGAVWLGVRSLKRHRRIAVLWMALAVAFGGWWCARSFHWRSVPPATMTAAGELRVAFWNISHRRTVPVALHRLIKDELPDIAGMVEAEMLTDAEVDAVAANHRGWSVLRIKPGALCIVRGSARWVETVLERGRSRLHVLEANVTGHPDKYRLVLADVGPWPLLPRTVQLDRCRALAGNGARTIIMGDFNTPLDSVAFDAWRGHFRNAFADADEFHGWQESWPLGLPLLSLDHIWSSPDLPPRQAQKGWSLPCDHAWLTARLAVTQ